MGTSGKISRIWIGFVGALTALACSAMLAPAAQAGPLVASAPSCEDMDSSQVFLPWLDPSYYVLSPGGDFESAAEGWAVNGATVVDGNEPHYVGSQSDDGSLRLRGGDSATSPTMCVGIEHPHMRFFARNDGSTLSALHVEVLFEDAGGSVHSAPIGAVTASSGWQLTAPMPLAVNLLPLLPGDYTPVAFEFTAGAGGDWRIDDVYVDPWRK